MKPVSSALGYAVRIFAVCLLASGSCLAQDPAGDSTAPAQGDGENASNPLAKVKNTDVRIQYFDNPDGSERWDYWIADGAFMATNKLKIKYELWVGTSSCVLAYRPSSARPIRCVP